MANVTNGNGNGHKEDMPKLTAKEKAALFEAWEKANIVAVKAQGELDKATRAKQVACAEIAAKIGVGAYTYKGQTLVLTKRTPKDAPEGTAPTYFFRQPSEVNAETIA